MHWCKLPEPKGGLVEAHGGAPLHGMVLTEDMFAATEMVAGGEVAFEAMKVDQLKAELAERGSTRSGRNAQGDPAAPSACVACAGRD